ncbi:MAG: glycosyltransferase [Romboutsia sp.]
MYIAFYISSHGFGHMTRCISIIQNLLNNSEYKVYVVCDKKQNDFCRIYLSRFSDRIIYKDIVTDVGFVNKRNSLEVDIIALKRNLEQFKLSLDYVIKVECEFLKTIDVKCVVSDISIIGCIVGKILCLPNIFASNFSWVEQYEHIGIDDSIINKFREAYSCVNKLIKYDLCLDMNSIDADENYDLGFVCRDIDEHRVSYIKLEYGSSIFITCGKSANLSCINVRNFEGTIFTTSGIEISCNVGCRVVELPVDVLDTQNYIAASEIVIAKAGWGTIAESILGHVGLVLVERPSAREDTFNIEKIKERKLGISIKESDLTNIDVDKIKEKLKNNIHYEKLKTYENDAEKVADLILNHL